MDDLECVAGIRAIVRWLQREGGIAGTAKPGVIDPSAVTSPAAAAGLRVAALGQLKNRTAGSESVWLYGGLLSDEWKSSDTFSQRNETDQRSIQTNNSNITPAYNALQQARGYTRTAIENVGAVFAGLEGDIAEMWFMLGFLRDDVGREFCNGIPLTNTVDGSSRMAAADQRLDLQVALTQLRQRVCAGRWNGCEVGVRQAGCAHRKARTLLNSDRRRPPARSFPRRLFRRAMPTR
jgi:hypothetical protein